MLGQSQLDDVKYGPYHVEDIAQGEFIIEHICEPQNQALQRSMILGWLNQCVVVLRNAQRQRVV
jgi:hypothetical protein